MQQLLRVAIEQWGEATGNGAAPSSGRGYKTISKVEAAKATPAASKGKAPAIPLEDILAVKALIERVGAGHLRTLIDVMAK